MSELEAIQAVLKIGQSRFMLLEQVKEMVIAGLDDGLSSADIAGNVGVVLETFEEPVRLSAPPSRVQAVGE